MKKCCVIAALPTGNLEIAANEGDLVIAADGGYLNAQNQGIIPDVILGDFDSLGFVPKGKEVIEYPVIKDDTDTMMAVKLGFERGYNRFYIYGAIGGRTDHTLANLQTLNFIAENGGRGFLVGENECITVIKDSFIEFKGSAKGTISVFSLTEKAEGVNICGLFYPLENQTLNNSFPLGVSNSFTGKASRIEVEKGTLAVVWSGGINYILEVTDEKGI